MAKDKNSWLQQGSLGVARVRFAFIGLLAVFNIVGDAWHLIAPGAILQRWMLIGVALVANALLWYGSRAQGRSAFYYRFLIYLQIALDICIATSLVYSERGIASKAVLLYILPIASSAVLLSRSALYATATVCTAVYGLTVIRYQFLNPGEAYKVELYASFVFYGLVFLVVAAVLRVALGVRSNS